MALSLCAASSHLRGRPRLPLGPPWRLLLRLPPRLLRRLPTLLMLLPLLLLLLQLLPLPPLPPPLRRRRLAGTPGAPRTLRCLRRIPLPALRALHLLRALCARRRSPRPLAGPSLLLLLLRNRYPPYPLPRGSRGESRVAPPCLLASPDSHLDSLD